MNPQTPSLELTSVAGPVCSPAGAQLQEQVAALKDEYSRLGDAMEKTQGSAMQARHP